MYEGVPDFFGLAEVKSFLSLLTVIDNLHNDDALVGTLLNTPFHFTDQELADIRLEKYEHVPFYEAFKLCAERNEKGIDQKCRRVADQLASWRKVSEGILNSDEPMLMYTPEAIEQTPLKTSVSTLTRQAPVISDEDCEETVEDKRKTEEAVHTFRLSSVASRPVFLEEEEAEAVNIGTATHRFLRLIDLDVFQQENVNMEQAVRSELERMKAEEILTVDEARLIRLHGVASFLKSELGQGMLRSKEIRREATFTMRIDPDQPTLVQGIVDCVFKENGIWILIDY